MAIIGSPVGPGRAEQRTGSTCSAKRQASRPETVGQWYPPRLIKLARISCQFSPVLSRWQSWCLAPSKHLCRSAWSRRHRDSGNSAYRSLARASRLSRGSRCCACIQTLGSTWGVLRCHTKLEGGSSQELLRSGLGSGGRGVRWRREGWEGGGWRREGEKE